MKEDDLFGRQLQFGVLAVYTRGVSRTVYHRLYPDTIWSDQDEKSFQKSLERMLGVRQRVASPIALMSGK